MSNNTFYIICYIWLGSAVVIHGLMFFVTAPFGRHTSEKWGPMINNKAGWILMEFPSLAIMGYFLLTGSENFNSFVWVLFAVWIIHYLNRTLIYPLRIRPTEKKMPVFILLSAVFFNLMNAGLNGFYLDNMTPQNVYTRDWLLSWNFMAGAGLFVTGMVINWKSDSVLISLRGPGETGYKIPEGFLFRYISCPNLFGEIVEWSGFALMAWNLPALTFMVWTFANLVPRAKNHHDWYLKNFPDYPGGRKIVFPFIY